MNVDVVGYSLLCCPQTSMILFEEKRRPRIDERQDIGSVIVGMREDRLRRYTTLLLTRIRLSAVRVRARTIVY